MGKDNNPFAPVSRLDAAESAFFTRELEYIKAQTYDIKYKQLKAFDLIPISSEAGAGATEITWRQFYAVGIAKIIQDYAKDFPRVDTYGVENTVKVKSLGASYGWTIQELRQSQMTNRRLDQRRAEIARRAIEELINTISLSGDTNSGLLGLINYPGITQATSPADGTGSATTWVSKTPDQIIRDVLNLTNAVVAVTNGREMPDHLLLPLAQYNDISTRRISTVSDTTLLQYILQTSPYIKVIDWLVELKGAGSGSTDRALMYTMDPMHLTLEIPQQFEQFDAIQDGMFFQVPCHARLGGVIVYYPQSISYGDGI